MAGWRTPPAGGVGRPPGKKGGGGPAAKRFAACLHRVFEATKKAGRFEDARALAEEVARECPGTPEARWVRDGWSDARVRWAQDAMKQGDVARAEALAAEIDADGAPAGAYRHVFEEYGRFRLERWRAERRTGNESAAMPHLMAAADALAQPEGANEVVQALLQEWEAADLAAAGERLRQGGAPAAALAFFATAGLRSSALGLSGEDAEALRDRADECRLELARRARAAGRLTSDRGGDRTADGFYAHVANSRCRDRQVEAQTGLIEVYRDSAMRRAGNDDFFEGNKDFQRALMHARALWRLRSEAPGADPWAGLPEDARARAAAAEPSGDPERLLHAVRNLVNEGKLEGKSPVRRAFLLTLLADALPADPAAVKARAEVVPFALAEAGKNAPGEAPAAFGPSGLAGRSVHRIENDTPTYLLLFYDGPERFFVRLAPRRRGSVVLADGKYLTAVMTSREGVLSYRAEFPTAGGLLASQYSIVEGGGRETQAFGGDWTVGDFRLLRVPGGADSGFAVDPATGLVTAR